MARVLVVEGRGAHRAATLLAAEGLAVATALDASEAVEAIQSLQPDLVLVEIVSPTGDCVDLCRRLRAVTSISIAVLTNPCAERDAVAVFGAGVDTMITEPVGPHELVARVRALLRRRPLAPVRDDETIVVGAVAFDRARRELSVNGAPLPVPRREMEIAELLMRNAGRVVARSVIVRELWGSMRDTKSLDVQVGRLRTRLAQAGAGQCIVTVRGVGFRFSGSDELDQVIDLTSETEMITAPGR
jgi:two-component system response regulator RegX3